MTLVQTELKSMKIWQRQLPVEYQEVEYIESHGEEYIDTGVPCIYGEQYSINVDFQRLDEDEDSHYIFGYRGMRKRGLYLGFAFGDFDIFDGRGSIGPDYGGFTNYSFTPSTYTYNTRYVFDGDFDTGTVDGEGNLTLFSWYSGTSPISAKLYSCEVKVNGVQVRDFVPCYRKSDGEIGLYDLVNNVFYTNSGTGIFTKGNNIINLVEKEIKRITMRKQEEQTTTIYGPSSEVYGNINIYSGTAPSDGIYDFSAEVFAVSGYYGCIGIIINGVTVETFRTGSTSYVPFTYQTTLTAGDSIVLSLYGEPNQNAGCRNVQIDTVAIDRTEKQIRPVIKEYDIDISNFKNIETYSTSGMYYNWAGCFSRDGMKFYVSDNGTGVYEYTLNSPYDLSSYSSSTHETASGQIHQVYISPDGKHLAFASYNSFVGIRELAIPNDITTIIDYKSANFTSPVGIWFKPDGTRMYVGFYNSNGIRQYDLSTPRDITTATQVGILSTGTERGVTISKNGTSLLRCDGSNQSPRYAYQYTLSTPWDITTATQTRSVQIGASMFSFAHDDSCVVFDNNVGFFNELSS